MEVRYHKEVTEALEKLKNGGDLHIVHCADEEDLAKSVSKGAVREVDSGFIYETGTPLFCRNPFQPSDHIKAETKGWIDGRSVCRRWNKCLFCDNVVIVDLVLPKLIAYNSKLKLDMSTADGIPGKLQLLENTIAIIDAILQPGEFFDARTIDDARTRAGILSGEEADQFFYKGVGAWS